MRVLLTGSAGFIGSHAMDALLAEGIPVRGLDILPARLPGHHAHSDRIDLLDRAGLRRVFEEFAPTHVIHLAAQTNWDRFTDPDVYYAPNTRGVENLVAAIQSTPCVQRAVFTSTQLVCHVNYRPSHELDYAPTTHYGESKVQTEMIVRAASGGGVEWCIARPTTIWGPRMKPHYQTFLNMVRRGLYFHVGRDPLLKSYGYVGNTVHQYLKLLNAPKADIHGRTLYLADYEPLSLREWIITIQETYGARKVPTVPVAVAQMMARLGDGLNAIGISAFPFNTFRLTNVLTTYIFDVSETQRICGPLPYGMRDGVRHMIDWMRLLEHGDPSGAGAAPAAVDSKPS
jgi:nucleoside-diphosphate-sugar epimerase